MFLFTLLLQSCLFTLLLQDNTIVGILTFISRINYRLGDLNLKISINLGLFQSYEQFKFYAQLS